MKQFWAFVKKEFYHITRDVMTMMILLGIPVVQIVLFGFAITTEVRNAQIAVLDPSRDTTSTRIAQHLEASEYFDIAAYLSNALQIEDMFKKGAIKMAVVFEEDFGKNLTSSGKTQIQIIADATDPNTATLLANYATGVIAAALQEQRAKAAVPYSIIPEVKMLYNPRMKGAYNFVPGVLGMILMLICAMMTSISIVREKETGTMAVLLVSPIRPIYIILAKAVPYFLLSCINLVTILLLSVFVLEVPVAGSIFLLVLVSLLFIFVALCLGLLVSTITHTQMAAMLVSGMAFMMPVMLLSGMMFPVENMPPPLQWLSHIIPAKWYIIAVKNLMIKGLGLSSILKEMAILFTMALVLLGVSLKQFKNRLE